MLKKGVWDRVWYWEEKQGRASGSRLGLHLEGSAHHDQSQDQNQNQNQAKREI